MNHVTISSRNRKLPRPNGHKHIKFRQSPFSLPESAIISQHHNSKSTVSHNSSKFHITTMATPIPIASVGANPAIVRDIQLQLLPEYKIVHVCFDPVTATSELPGICSGDHDIEPSSGLGTNAHRSAADREIPKAIIFGGGVSGDEAQAITQAVHDKVPEIKALHVTKQDILDAGAEGPNPEVISAVLRKKLVALGDLSDCDA
ncbi:hypothetical protein QBC38DRAFT_472980 [Podospora fimiseda]|uniref:Uncharacterized protein n=1 Tax=Podospora fimiseda TaxID=252190 RepID=A0AAN7BTN1_9PEZI|nr:hypothetical protein QBC38DRAFT_472980 [Podospora fimiseda]